MSKDDRKKRDPRLALRRETLRALDAAQLAAVLGGVSPTSKYCPTSPQP